jgi:HD-GYP domain-containing protein (c-di-GMP phosphodiesterase class II)
MANENNTAPLFTQTSSLFFVSKKLIEVCETRHPKIPDLYRIICLDPILFVMTQKLYHYFYPESKKHYNSIAKIIIALNSNTIKNYLLDFAHSASSLIEMKKVSAAEIKRQEKCWRHTHSVAIAARFIAKSDGICPEKLEEYYAAGLTHDLDEYTGMDIPPCNLVFDKNFPEAVIEAHQ